MAFDSIEFLEHAVGIASHEDVDAMADYLCETLRENGVEPTVDGAGNVLATREASTVDTDSPHVVLNTHIDTVTPHVPRRRDGDVLYGRGSCDAKGPLAAMLAAFFACTPERGRLTLAVTPDEESYSTGAAALVDELDLDAERGDSVVVGEPTDLEVCNAAKGRFEGVLKIRGESAHAAEPDGGTNAIALAAPVIEALDKFDDRPDGLSSHPDLGAPMLTPTTITGGEATNQVPAACEITVDRRSVPPETADGFERTVETFLRDRLDVPDALTFRLTERETPFLEAFETRADSAVVSAFQEASAGSVRPFTAATEASYFASEVPTVVFGPGVLADTEGPVAHADREYVSLPDVTRAAEVLETALAELLRETHV